MFVHVIKAEYLSGYKIRIKFNNHKSGVIDLKNELYGEVFEPLKNTAYFKTFHLDKNAKTLSWDNGADFAPEFLYAKLKK